MCWHKVPLCTVPPPPGSGAQHPEGSMTLPPAPWHTRGCAEGRQGNGGMCPKGDHSKHKHPNGTRPCTCHAPALTQTTQQKPLRTTCGLRGSASALALEGSPSPPLQGRSTSRAHGSPGMGVPAPLLLTATNAIWPGAGPPLTRQQYKARRILRFTKG